MNVKIEIPDPLEKSRLHFLSRIYDVRDDMLDWAGPVLAHGRMEDVVELVDNTILGVLAVIDGNGIGETPYVLLPAAMFTHTDPLPNLAGTLTPVFHKLFLDIND